jgi:translation initiation factor IF-3
MAQKPKQKFRGRIIKENEHKINKYITAPELRLVGDNVEARIYSLQEALDLADDLGVDLVEISPNAVPPIGRCVDYNKFLYEKKKKDKEVKANAIKSEMKEVRFTPNTDDHDFDFKAKHAEKFLKDGDKVKAYVQFKGRAIMFQERGQLILLKFAEKLQEVGQLEGLPKLEGKRMHIMLSPKKKAK